MDKYRLRRTIAAGLLAGACIAIGTAHVPAAVGCGLFTCLFWQFIEEACDD